MINPQTEKNRMESFYVAFPNHKPKDNDYIDIKDASYGLGANQKGYLIYITNGRSITVESWHTYRSIKDAYLAAKERYPNIKVYRNNTQITY